MNNDPKRLDGETYKDYKARRKAGQEALKTNKFFHISKFIAYEDGLPTTRRIYQPLTYVKGMEPRR